MQNVECRFLRAAAGDPVYGVNSGNKSVYCGGAAAQDSRGFVQSSVQTRLAICADAFKDVQDLIGDLLPRTRQLIPQTLEGPLVSQDRIRFQLQYHLCGPAFAPPQYSDLFWKEQLSRRLSSFLHRTSIACPANAGLFCSLICIEEAHCLPAFRQAV